MQTTFMPIEAERTGTSGDGFMDAAPLDLRLWEYLQHKEYCRWRRWYKHECSCGLATLLERE